MTTIESPAVRAIWNAVEAKIGAGRVSYGGSVPDLATELRHSYHRSWDDSPHDLGYSVHYSGDRSWYVQHTAAKYACAIDLTFHDPADMRKATARLVHWATTTANNWTGLVRSPWLREIAGTLDSQNVYALDTSRYRAPVRTYGWDDSHLWHVHLSINRCHVLDGRLASIVSSALGDW